MPIQILLCMKVMLCRLENSFTNFFPTIMGRLHRMDGSHIMGRYFGGLRPVGQPRSRRKVAVWRDDVDLFQIQDWNAAARKRECWSEKLGEATAPERAESPDKQEKNIFFPILTIILFVKFRLLNLVVLFLSNAYPVVFEYAINQPYTNTSLDTTLLIIYHQRHVTAL